MLVRYELVWGYCDGRASPLKAAPMILHKHSCLLDWFNGPIPSPSLNGLTGEATAENGVRPRTSARHEKETGKNDRPGKREALPAHSVAQRDGDPVRDLELGRCVVHLSSVGDADRVAASISIHDSERETIPSGWPRRDTPANRRSW